MGRSMVLLLLAGSGLVRAQIGASSPGATGSTRAVTLPAAGLNGSALVQQVPGTSGVNTVTSSVQVAGDFSGSVPQPVSGSGAISLSLSAAVQRALKANLGGIVASRTVAEADAQRLQALSALLPDISANLSETVTQVNLAAYGFQFKLPPGSAISIPSVVGPFSYSQAQASLSQSLFDLVRRRNWQAAKEDEKAARLSLADAREAIVLAAGGIYLQTVFAAARLDSEKAQVANAEAIYNQAVTRKAAGTNAKIDVMRSLVELQTEQQRLSSLDADLRKQKITLARIVGLPLDRDLLLTDALPAANLPLRDTTDLLAEAYRKRSDVQALQAQVTAATLAVQAAHAERLPTAGVNGDYGVLGPNPTSTHGVFAVTGSVNIPIWQGGRVKGDIAQADSVLREREAELANAKARVEQDVRTAQIDLEAAGGQAKVAETNRGYAQETLTEARDRFTAGVSTTVEVVQAQQQVASAEADYLSSLFALDLARLSLARATGIAESEMPHLAKGAQ